MQIVQEALGRTSIVGPDQGDSFWQPVPANGYVRNILNSRALNANSDFSIGTQTVAPGCFIREHTHAANEEIIFVVEGRGVARIDGVERPIEKGSAVYIGVNRKHHFLNPHAEALTFLWIMLPGGLDRFFAEIGRPRRNDEPAPAPFPRPENVAEIEARTVFGWVDASFNQPQSPERLTEKN
jgi:mannose-6-phosphate isomerase-like protein (cupin superfamily)